MSKKLSWLDKFAEEQANKAVKTASLNKQAQRAIVAVDSLKNVVEGQEVEVDSKMYKVIDANFVDEKGPGILLEEIPQMSIEMGTNPVPEVPAGQKKVTDAPERAVQPDQGSGVYHIEVRDTVEVDKFNEEAAQTEQQIAGENAVDATTPEGRVNRVLNRITVPSPSLVEEVVTEEVVTEETIEIEEVEIEETIETEEVEIEETLETEDATETEEDEKPLIANRILRKIIESNSK